MFIYDTTALYLLEGEGESTQSSVDVTPNSNGPRRHTKYCLGNMI